MIKKSTEELPESEVINLLNGAKLGYACDFEFDACDGRILSLIIPGERGLFGNAKTPDIIIPWRNIECFGEDTILVKIPPGEYCFAPEKKKKKKNCGLS